MTQSEVYKALDKVYSNLQRMDDLSEHTEAQRDLVERLEQRASELEAMKL